MESVGCGRREVFEPTLSIPDHERLFAERSHQGEKPRVAFKGASCEDLASRAMLNRSASNLVSSFLRRSPKRYFCVKDAVIKVQSSTATRTYKMPYRSER